VGLHELSIKYGSDKAEHGYCKFYEKHLPGNPRKVLEIGVKDGASIQMWHEYYPNAEIHGLDLFSEKSARDVWDNCFAGKEGSDKIIFHQGNQCDWLMLEQLRKFDFDVIIDDGSHNSRDQLITFAGLFNGKHYFIEDIHCCREEFYRQGLPYEATIDRQFDFDYPLRPFMQDRDENIIVFYDQDK
jgi:hypothetical protein